MGGWCSEWWGGGGYIFKAVGSGVHFSLMAKKGEYNFHLTRFHPKGDL